MNDAVKHDQIARALRHNFLAHLSSCTSIRAIHISATIICHFCTLFFARFQRNPGIFYCEEQIFVSCHESHAPLNHQPLHEHESLIDTNKLSYSVCTLLAVSYFYSSQMHNSQMTLPVI